MQKATEEHQHNRHSKHHHSEHHNHQEHHGHGGHDKHAGHSPELFKRRFFICLILTLPVLYFSSQLQNWLGYQAITFPGYSLITLFWASSFISMVGGYF